MNRALVPLALGFAAAASTVGLGLLSAGSPPPAVVVVQGAAVTAPAEAAAAAAEPVPAPVAATPATPATPAAPAAPASPTTVVSASRPAATTVTLPTPVVPPLARPGHFACTGEDNATADCVNDETGADVTPNGGDDPARLRAAQDPAYAADLTAQLCAVKPWAC